LKKNIDTLCELLQNSNYERLQESDQSKDRRMKNAQSVILYFNIVSAASMIACGTSNQKKNSDNSATAPIASSSLTPEMFTSFQGDVLSGPKASENLSTALSTITLPTSLEDPKLADGAQIKTPDDALDEEQLKRKMCKDKIIGALKPFSVSGDTVRIQFDYEDTCDGPAAKYSYSMELTCAGAKFSLLNGKRLDEVLLASKLPSPTFLLPIWQLCPKDATSVLWSSRMVKTINTRWTPTGSGVTATINSLQAFLTSAPDGTPCVFKPSATGIRIEKCMYFYKEAGGASASGESFSGNGAATVDYSERDVEFYQGSLAEGVTKVTVNGWSGSAKTEKQENENQGILFFNRTIEISKDGSNYTSPAENVGATAYRVSGEY
jgi:hypothetical protein